MNRRFVFATASIAALATASAAYWYVHHRQPAMQLAAGEPLNQSTSQINVLEEAQPVTQSNELLPSQASISTPAPVAPPPPAVFDATAAQLGTTLALLANSWQQGGQLPHQLANAAAQLATATGQPAVAEAATLLRSATPREGPITQALLLVEAAHALTLPPPEDLPATAEQAEAEKSWFRKQLEKLISIRSTPATQNSWSLALGTVQQHLARGTMADARQSLMAAPLAEDPRLNTLRELTDAYLAQTARLTNLITTYTNTFLQPDTP